MKEFFFARNQETTNTQETITLATQQQNNTKKNSKKDPKESGYRVYIRSERKWISVSKEYYETYMREIGAFKKKQYRQGLCKCPGTKEYMCDCDCLTCPFYKKDVFVSLDAPIFDDEGNEETLMDRLMDEVTLSPEEEVLVKDEHESLYRAIEQLCDEDKIVIRMTLEDRSQIEIAEALGLKGQSNIRYRKLRALKKLKTIFSDKYGFIIS